MSFFYTEIEARVWYEMVQHVYHFQEPYLYNFHDWIHNVIKNNNKFPDKIYNGHTYSFVYLNAFLEVNPELQKLDLNKLIPFVKDEALINACTYINSLIKTSISDELGNTVPLVVNEMMHVRPEDFYLNQQLLEDFDKLKKEIESLSQVIQNIEYLISEVCIGMYGDGFYWFNPVEAHKRIVNWANLFAEKNIKDFSHIYNKDIFPENNRKLMNVAKTVIEKEKQWEEIRAKEKKDRENEQNQSSAKNKCLNLIGTKYDLTGTQKNIAMMEADLTERRDQVIKNNPNISIYLVYQKIIIDLLNEIEALNSQLGQQLKEEDIKKKLFFEIEVQKWTYWYFLVKQLDWNEDEFKKKCLFNQTINPESPACLQAIVDQIDYKTNAVERFLAY